LLSLEFPHLCDALAHFEAPKVLSVPALNREVLDEDEASVQLDPDLASSCDPSLNAPRIRSTLPALFGGWQFETLRRITAGVRGKIRTEATDQSMAEHISDRDLLFGMVMIDLETKPRMNGVHGSGTGLLERGARSCHQREAQVERKD